MTGSLSNHVACIFKVPTFFQTTTSQMAVRNKPSGAVRLTHSPLLSKPAYVSHNATWMLAVHFEYLTELH